MTYEHTCKHEYLYRGVSEEMELKGIALKPKRDFKESPYALPRAGIAQAEDSTSRSAEKEHVFNSGLHHHGFLSTSPIFEIAKGYALSDNKGFPSKVGYVYKLKVIAMKNIAIKDTADNPARHKPQDQEHLLRPLDPNLEFDFGKADVIPVYQDD